MGSATYDVRVLEHPLPSLQGPYQNVSDIDIFILPEINNKTPQTFLDALYAIAPHARIIEFSHKLPDSVDAVWRSLVELGEKLLEELLKFSRTDATSKRRPLLLVGHGLGGIIVKRALNSLHEDFYKPGHQALIEAESGLIFLGVPHLTYGRQSSWSRLGLLLRHAAKVSKAAALSSKAEIVMVANVSSKFEEAGIEVPVISAYETKGVRISDNPLISNRELLVDRKLAEIGLKNERLVETPHDHQKINQTGIGSKLFAEMNQMIRLALNRFWNDSDQTKEPVVPSTQHDGGEHLSTSSGTDAQNSLRLSPNINTPQETAVSTDISGYEFIPSAANFSEPERIIKLPCHLFGPHSQNPMFFGRDEVLEQLDRVLCSSDEDISNSRTTGLRSFALSSLGGVGKTQIAIEYAFSRKHKFDAVFWVQASNSAKLADSFTQISIELGLEDASQAGDRVISRNIVMSWLTNPVWRLNGEDKSHPSQTKLPKWLLIFDNADNLELLLDHWPLGNNGAIIVTSRDPLAKSYLYCKQGIDLEPLPPNDASLLLQRLIGQDEALLGDKDALAVSRRLDGLPLAIIQAAAYIQRQDITYSEFLAMYEEGSIAEDFQHTRIGHRQQYPHDLSTVWSLDSLSVEAKTLLSILSFMDPDCVDEEILAQRLSGHLDHLHQYQLTGAKYVQCRTELLKSSLIKRNKDLGQLIIHRLTQDMTRLSLSREQSREIFNVAAALSFNFWPVSKIPFSHNVGDWVPSRKVVPHALSLHSLYLKGDNLLSDSGAKKVFAQLLQKVGWYLVEIGGYDDALPILETAQRICETDTNAMLEVYSHVLFSLGFVASQTYRSKLSYSSAEKNLRIRLEMARKDKYLALAFFQRAIAFIVDDNFEKAIELLQACLDVYAELPEVLSGEYRPDFPHHHLATILCEVDRASEAAAIVLENIRFREKKYGPNDTESIKLGLNLQTLGKARTKQGFLTEAIDAYQRAMINYKATVGNKHPHLGRTCISLAQVYISLGQWDSARILITQALSIFENRPHLKPELAQALHSQSKIATKCGDESLGEKLMERANSLYTEVVRNGQGRKATLEEIDFDKIGLLI